MRGQEEKEKKRNKVKIMMRTMMHSCGPSKQQRRARVGLMCLSDDGATRRSRTVTEVGITVLYMQ